MTLKLEVGKTYVTASGEPVNILSKDNDVNYPFNGSDSGCYTPGGQYYVGGPCSLDLVSELQEPGAQTADMPGSADPHRLHRKLMRAEFLDSLMLKLVDSMLIGPGTGTNATTLRAFAEIAAARDAAE